MSGFDDQGAAWRRRRVRGVGATAAVVAVLAATTAAAVSFRDGDSDGEARTVAAPTPVPTKVPSPRPSTAFSTPTRLVSAYGLETAVPATWGTNDIGCNMTAAPTVVVSQGAVDACGYTEPATKEVVELVPGGRGGVDLGPPAIDPRWSDVEVDGEPARRGVARLPDGRTEAVLRLTRLNTAVSVRVRDPRLAAAVLDSTRVVRDLDSNGCAVTRSRTPLATRAAAPVDLGEPDWIGVCYYERDRRQEQDRLGLSHRQAGRALDALLSALRRAPAGANPDVPENCLDDALSTLALVLVLHTDGEPDRHLIVYFEGCVGRGIQHDSGVATVTQRVLKAAFAGTSFGWSWSDGVPAG